MRPLRRSSEEICNSDELLITIVFQQFREALLESLKEPVQLCPTCFIALNDDPAAVLCVAHTMHKTTLFEAIYQVRHRWGRQSCVASDFSGGERPPSLKQIERLLLGGPETHALGNHRMKEDRHRATL